MRVERLARRIEDEGLQINPVVCIRESDSDFVLLDGATRTAAFRSLGLRFGVVQVVRPDMVVLGTWNHLIRGAEPVEVVEAIRARDDLRLSADSGKPRVLIPVGQSWSVVGVGVSPNAALSSLVATYNGRWGVNRVIDTTPDELSQTFPEWALAVEFPVMSIRDVTRAAMEADLLPAGITRFVVSDRALRVNFDLDVLRSPGSSEEKQAQLDAILAERAGQGRIRRYDEPVIILDD